MLAPARVKNEEGDMRQDVKRSLYGFNKTHTLIQSTAINLCVAIYFMTWAARAWRIMRPELNQARLKLRMEWGRKA